MNTLAARGIGGFTKMLDHYEARAPLHRNVELEELGATGLFLATRRRGGDHGPDDVRRLAAIPSWRCRGAAARLLLGAPVERLPLSSIHPIKWRLPPSPLGHRRHAVNMDRAGERALLLAIKELYQRDLGAEFARRSARAHRYLHRARPARHPRRHGNARGGEAVPGSLSRPSARDCPRARRASWPASARRSRPSTRIRKFTRRCSPATSKEGAKLKLSLSRPLELFRVRRLRRRQPHPRRARALRARPREGKTRHRLPARARLDHRRHAARHRLRQSHRREDHRRRHRRLQRRGTLCAESHAHVCRFVGHAGAAGCGPGGKPGTESQEGSVCNRSHRPPPQTDLISEKLGRETFILSEIPLIWRNLVIP